MRAWILSAALAAAVMGGLPTSTFAAPTPTPKAEPSPTQTKGKPAPTAVLPSPTATASPTPKPAPPTATPVPPTANGLTRTAATDDAGSFSFDALVPGPYQVSVAVPMNYVATTDAAQDIEVVQDVDAEDVRFGLISTEAAGLTPDASGPEATGSDDEQIIALASVTSLPLRF